MEVVPRKTPTLDSDLVEDMGKYITRYVVLPSEDHTLVLATWALHTHLLRVTEVTPYLYIYSPDPGMGKTLVVNAVSLLTRNSRMASDMTPSVMFKLIAREQSTLYIDEANTKWAGNQNNPLRCIANTGYKRGGSAWREQGRDLVEFPTFSAKVFAGLDNGFMPRDVRDRCIPFELKAKAPSQTVERFKESYVRRSPELKELHDRIAAFVEDFGADVAVQLPEPMTMVSDRQDELSEPLLAIASVLGYENRLRDSLKALFSNVPNAKPNPVAIIMQRIRNAFGEEDRIFTDELLAQLVPAFKNGRALALYLNAWGIAPQEIRIGADHRRGYVLEQFEAAFHEVLGIPPTQLLVVDSDDGEEVA